MKAKLLLIATMMIVTVMIVILPTDMSALFMRLGAIGIIALYIVPKLIIDLSYSPKDWLTSLRLGLILSFVSVLLASVPTILVQYLRAKGIAVPEALIEIAKVTGNLSFLMFAIIWVLILHYRDRRQLVPRRDKPEH